MPITVPQDENVLVSYFRTGDKPTQDQCEELIRTMFYLYTDMVNKANAALAAANAATTTAQNFSYKAAGIFLQATMTGTVNIASIAILGSNQGALLNLRITFITPMANTNYKPIGTGFTVNAKNVNYIDVIAPNNGNGTFWMVIFP